MKTLWWVLLVGNISRAQFGSTLFDIPVHARASAMGESFVAVANDAYAPYFNPASVAFIKGMNFAASYYPQNYFVSQDANIVSLAGVFSAGYLGNLGINYTEQNILRNNRFADPGLDTVYTYDVKHRILSISSAGQITKNLAIGFSFKSYTGKFSNLKQVKPGNYPSINLLDLAGAFVDIGILYGKEFGIKTSSRQQISLGSSFSNINIGSGFQTGQVAEASRIWRNGAAYRFYYHSPQSIWKSFSSTASLEWQYLANQRVTGKNIYALGWENTFAQVFSLRAGSIYRPMPTFSSRAKTWQFHWGAGLDLPVHLLFHTHSAIIVSIDYAQISVSGVPNVTRSDLFSLQLVWLGTPPPSENTGDE